MPPPNPLLEIVQQYTTGSSGPPFAWDSLQESASQEGLAGLLAVMQCDRVDCPPASQFAKREYFRLSKFYAELVRINHTLTRSGLQAVVLKGHALLPLYGGRVGLRPLRDIDLLARPGQVSALQQALGEPNSRAVDIDVSQDLVSGQRIRMRTRAFRFPVEDAWARSQAFSPNFPALRRLGPDDQFLHLAVHALKHAYSRLIWLVDLALAVPSLNPDSVLELAHQTGSQRAAALALELVRQSTGIESPLGSRLPPLNRWERASLARILDRTLPAELGELLTLNSLPRLRDKLAFTAEFVFLRPTIVRELYPGPLWRAYLRRLQAILALILGHLTPRGRNGSKTRAMGPLEAASP